MMALYPNISWESLVHTGMKDTVLSTPTPHSMNRHHQSSSPITRATAPTKLNKKHTMERQWCTCEEQLSFREALWASLSFLSPVHNCGQSSAHPSSASTCIWSSGSFPSSPLPQFGSWVPQAALPLLAAALCVIRGTFQLMWGCWGQRSIPSFPQCQQDQGAAGTSLLFPALWVAELLQNPQLPRLDLLSCSLEKQLPELWADPVWG